MKYDDFKIFKLSTILKIIDFRRYNFSRIYKNINFRRYKYILLYVVDFIISIIKYIFFGILKSINFIRYNFLRIYKNIDFKRHKSNLVLAIGSVVFFIKYIFYRIYKISNLRRLNFSRIYNSINLRRFNFSRIYNSINLRRFNFLKVYKLDDFKIFKFSTILKIIYLKKNQYIPLYGVGFIIFVALIYLSIPMFFNFDKSRLENTICKGFNIKCSIHGKIKYSFLPSPRIKIKDLIIQDFVDKKKTLGKIDNAVIKLSFYNLSNKNKFNFTKIELRNAEINFDLHELKEYKNFFKKKFNLKPINLKKSEIKFFDGEKDIATIKDVNFKYKTNKNVDDVILKGDFLNDDIYINLKNKKNENDLSTIFILKFLDTKTKINIFNSDLDKNTISGNISFKKGKNKLTSIFDYKDDQIIFKQANLRNIFLDGKFNGEVKFLPYFNFNLNVDLSSINFNIFRSSLIALDEKNKKNLFKVNEKINGQLNLSADKIFSKRTLIDSFESRIKFINGNISIEQLLLNMGKLGAADVTGIIKSNKKFSNFKFENNIFVDNLRRFYNKFGIFNKQNISSNVFISGNFDLVNLRLRLNEISDDKKFKDEDVAYIEREFNDLVLEDGYASLFNFLKLKEFLKLIATEIN